MMGFQKGTIILTTTHVLSQLSLEASVHLTPAGSMIQFKSTGLEACLSWIKHSSSSPSLYIESLHCSNLVKVFGPEIAPTAVNGPEKGEHLLALMREFRCSLVKP